MGVVAGELGVPNPLEAEPPPPPPPKAPATALMPADMAPAGPNQSVPAEMAGAPIMNGAEK